MVVHATKEPLDSLGGAQGSTRVSQQCQEAYLTQKGNGPTVSEGPQGPQQVPGVAHDAPCCGDSRTPSQE
eukprot:12394340-Alexandrium_andersonii.AAC.1